MPGLPGSAMDVRSSGIQADITDAWTDDWPPFESTERQERKKMVHQRTENSFVRAVMTARRLAVTSLAVFVAVVGVSAQVSAKTMTGRQGDRGQRSGRCPSTV
jgi:hypothetical protein